MQLNRKWILYLFSLLLGLGWLVVSADRGGLSTTGHIPAPQKGFLAPDFSLQTLDGQSIMLSNLRGQVVLVNFWASWCPPCKAEMPAMQRIHAEYEGLGFTVLAVHSTVQDTQAGAARFVSQNGLTFPIPLDADGEVTRLYAIRSLPTSFFIGQDGIIRDVVVGGPMSEALLRTRVETLLEETP